jgi:hypothetical protein
MNKKLTDDVVLDKINQYGKPLRTLELSRYLALELYEITPKEIRRIINRLEKNGSIEVYFRAGETPIQIGPKIEEK